jgi:hypothetical protein
MTNKIKTKSVPITDEDAAFLLRSQENKPIIIDSEHAALLEKQKKLRGEKKSKQVDQRMVALAEPRIKKFMAEFNEAIRNKTLRKIVVVKDEDTN